MTKNESNLNTIINVWGSYTIKNIGIHSTIINVGIRSTIKNVRTNALQSRLDYHDIDTYSTVNKIKSSIFTNIKRPNTMHILATVALFIQLESA